VSVFSRNPRGLRFSNRDVSPGSISRALPTIGVKSSHLDEVKLVVQFPVADGAVPVFHGLGRTPIHVETVLCNTAGKVYTDIPLVADNQMVALKCNTAGTTAHVIVR